MTSIKINRYSKWQTFQNYGFLEFPDLLFKKYKHDKTENNDRQTQNANRCQDFLRRRN